MRSLRFGISALVLALVVAALPLLSPPPALAQAPAAMTSGGGSSSCGPGKACRSSSFTASGTTTGVTIPSGSKICIDGSGCTRSLSYTGGAYTWATAGVSAASYTSTATSGNSAFLVTQGAKYCGDASCTAQMYSDGFKWIVTSSEGMYVNAGKSVRADIFKSYAASGNNAFQVDGAGGRIDLGGGTSDYMKTDSTGGLLYGLGIRANATNTARPTCDSTVRGQTWFVEGGAGVADTYAVCAKDAANAYAWRTIY